MAKQYASGYNTWVPSPEATDGLVIDFSRNPESFAMNQYCQIRNVSKKVGLYAEMAVEEAARIFSDALGSDFVWADGADRPMDFHGTEAFEWKEYRTIRRWLGYVFGNEATEQAAWDLLAQHARIKAQQAMTLRSNLVSTVVTTSGNYDSTHVVDCSGTAIGNTGNWEQSTSERQDIKRFLQYAMELIHKDTLGGVDVERDLRLVMSPATAANIARSQEIIDFIKQSQETPNIIENNRPGSRWMLPKRLYGFDVVIEDAVKVTTKKDVGFTPTKSFCFPDHSIAVLSRPGGLEAPGSGPSFSTVSWFSYRDMEVYTKSDDENERDLGGVLDDGVAKMTAPVSGFLFTNATTS